VARASRQRRGVTARVSLEELAGDDPLAQIEGQQNAIILSTDLLGEIAVVQRGGGSRTPPTRCVRSRDDRARRYCFSRHAAIASASSTGLKPLSTRSPITVTGTVRKPRAMSSS
jgi:hypothetical protein